MLTWKASLCGSKLQPAGAVYFAMDEDDVRRVIAYPHAMIGSDGLPNDEVPHPRLWGSFPRVLGRYSRDEGLITLEDAVRKMSALPAQTFGLAPERGLLAVGAVADVVVFAAETVGDAATFEEPTLPSTGIASVRKHCLGCAVSFLNRSDLGGFG